jgi:hypothetical protein
VPYIITTRLVEGDPEAPRSAGVMSRRAVATLDEARGAVIRELEPRIHSAFEWDLGIEGGTVGPLNGVAMDVERVGWPELQRRGEYTRPVGPHPGPRDDAGILAAFNYAKGSNR